MFRFARAVTFGLDESQSWHVTAVNRWKICELKTEPPYRHRLNSELHLKYLKYTHFENTSTITKIAECIFYLQSTYMVFGFVGFLFFFLKSFQRWVNLGKVVLENNWRGESWFRVWEEEWKEGYTLGLPYGPHPHCGSARWSAKPHLSIWLRIFFFQAMICLCIFSIQKTKGCIALKWFQSSGFSVPLETLRQLLGCKK